MGEEQQLTERLVVEPEDDIRVPPVVQPRSSSQNDLSFRCDGAAKSAWVQRIRCIACRCGCGADLRDAVRPRLLRCLMERAEVLWVRSGSPGGDVPEEHGRECADDSYLDDAQAVDVR